MILVSLVLLAVLTGCTPAGPRALLDGERLLQERKHSQAIGRLQTATKALPSNAQAWNHLGLAYHKAGQPDAALRAYEQARRIDLNLTPVRYNLGCLLLEQNNPQAAIAELTTYTLLQRDSAEGWLKLGTAQLRARQLDNAERSFQMALQLRANWPQAWNGLGIIQTQRKRAKEALNCFNLALQKQADYAPALLNVAVLHQVHLNNRAMALQKYQEYLDVQPASLKSAAVQEQMRQLRAELTSLPRREPTNDVATASPPTQSPSDPAPPPRVVANQPTTRPAAIAAAVSNIVSSTTRPKPPVTNIVAPNEKLPSTNLVQEPARPQESPPPQSKSPPAILASPSTNVVNPASTSKIEVVQLADEPPPKVAQDKTSASMGTAPSASATPAQLEQASSLLSQQTQEPARAEIGSDKRRPLDRLNPASWFRGKRRSASGTTALEPIRESQQNSERAAGRSSELTNTVSEPSPAMAQRRYVYQASVKPRAGDRGKAEQFFARAVRAHRDRRLAEAIQEYRQAAALDPSFFEAHYNLGLAAYELKDLPQSLSAYETALSMNPTSANGRYNFALALEQAGYYQDAVTEYQTAIEQHPEESRAHFSLASLYADKLAKPDLARRHYRRVLELEPQHPQAPAIRFWLAANP